MRTNPIAEQSRPARQARVAGRRGVQNNVADVIYVVE